MSYKNGTISLFVAENIRTDYVKLCMVCSHPLTYVNIPDTDPINPINRPSEEVYQFATEAAYFVSV